MEELSQHSPSHQVPLPRNIIHPGEVLPGAHGMAWGTRFLLNKQAASEDSSRMNELCHLSTHPSWQEGEWAGRREGLLCHPSRASSQAGSLVSLKWLPRL